jgi:DNA-directed RNA polymerase subunit M
LKCAFFDRFMCFERGCLNVSGLIFCDECGSMMYVMRMKDKEIYKCRRCGAIKECNENESVDKDAYKIVTEFKHSEKDRLEIQKKTDNVNTMPTTRMDCPKCGHLIAEYWQSQTRGADEGMTTFYRCLKCKFTWRAY